jgi:hypothetical protein
MSSSRRGLLLVEASLSAAVIAVGLVLVSRSLAGPLRALRTIEEREALLSLARERLIELDARAASGGPLPAETQGTFEPPDDAYAWNLRTHPAAETTGADGEPAVTEVLVSVKRLSGGSSAVSLSGLWSTDRVPSEWR